MSRKLLAILLLLGLIALQFSPIVSAAKEEEADDADDGDDDGADDAEEDDEGDDDDDDGEFAEEDEDDELNLDDLDLDDENGGRTEFLQFQVEEYIDAIESLDSSEMMNFFTDNATITINGGALTKAVFGDSVKEAFTNFAHLRISLTSPVYETDNRGHWTHNVYYEGKPGCVTNSKAIYTAEFDSNGKIIELSATYEPNFGVIVETIKACNNKVHTRTAEQDKLVAAEIARTRNFHKNTDVYLNPLTADATVSIKGAPTMDKAGYSNLVTGLASQSRVWEMNVASEIVVSDRTISYVGQSFIVTNKNCSGIYDYTVAATYNSNGGITALSKAFIGTTVEQIQKDFEQDCTDSANNNNATADDNTAAKQEL